MLEISAHPRSGNEIENQGTRLGETTTSESKPGMALTGLPNDPPMPAIAFPDNTTTNAAILPATAETLPTRLSNLHAVDLVPTPKIDWAIGAQDLASVEAERPAALLDLRAQTNMMKDNREAAIARKKAEAEQEAKETRERKERLRIKMESLGLDKTGQQRDVSGSYGEKKRKRARSEVGEGTPAQKHTKR